MSRTILMLLLVLMGCQASRAPRLDEPSRSANVDVPKGAPSESAPVNSTTATLDTQPSSETASHAQTGELPRLKPVTGKTFPDGTTPAMICEALNSKEPDLWVRFGHMIPVYMNGAIFVLQAGKDKEPAVETFVRKKYIMPHYSQQASCEDKTLLFVSNLMDESLVGDKPFGRVHLSGELEKHVGTKTLESFHFDERGQARLGAYCRADASVCDQLIRLNISARETGVCGDALSFVGILSLDVDYQRLLPKCKSLSAEEKACSRYNYPSTREGSEEKHQCHAKIRAALGIN